MIIGQTCNYDYMKSSVFSTEWFTEYIDTHHQHVNVELIPVDCIVRHVMMIPEDDEEIIWQEIWACDRWSNEFIDNSKKVNTNQ